MAWLVIADDNEKGPHIRADENIMGSMWQHELEHQSKILVAGSLREDDKVTKNGSVYLFDVETREEVVAIMAADPAAEMRDEVEIRWLNIAILDKVVQP